MYNFPFVFALLHILICGAGINFLSGYILQCRLFAKKRFSDGDSIVFLEDVERQNVER